jgi:hypothetical protein
VSTHRHTTIELLDTVAIICDLPEHGLIASDAFEVEFCDENGQTYAIQPQPLRANQIVALHNQGQQRSHSRLLLFDELAVPMTSAATLDGLFREVSG